MPIVTLTTDFGLKDHFAGSLKGALYTAIEDLSISEISHLITPFDIQQGAFTLGHSWHRYPEGTIHIVCVGPSPSKRFNHVLFTMDKHFFIGANNGLFSLMTEARPEEVVEICPAGQEPSSFPALDIYVITAAKIALGMTLAEIGSPVNGIAELIKPRHFPEDDVIKGNIVYIDSFGNLVTDISRVEFDRVGQGRAFSIQLIGDEITKVVRRYSDVDEGDKLALFNSEGILEIAINQGKANQLLNLRMNSVIRILFID